MLALLIKFKIYIMPWHKAINIYATLIITFKSGMGFNIPIKYRPLIKSKDGYIFKLIPKVNIAFGEFINDI